MKQIFDLAVIGGGIMGCGTALRASEGGMNTIIIDQSDMGQGAGKRHPISA